jgi:CheY-like chemotaxis protein
MGKIFILGSSQQIIDFGHTYVNVPYLENDISMHNWIVQLFEKNDIEKIVIEISDFPELSLKLGYHIRLSIEKLSSKVLIPILFVNRISLNEVILNSRLSSQILGTKGVYFSDFNLEDNKLEIDEIKGINVSDYVTGFLNIINIQPDETIGRHSLANIWGAFAMDNAANTRVLDTDADFKKSLYFKKVVARNHLLHLSRSFESIDNHNLNHQTIRIEAQNKKILYIDDEANKGWESVLKKLFNTSRIDDIVVINEKVKDFDSLSSRSKAIIENEIFDLYLVDLRLNGLDEDENIKTEEFSGMKVLQKIKSINRGNQVIIFTASNKSWNQKSLIDYGADGYFVKESPEYNFSIELSKSKLIYFKDEVESCLKMFFLREVNSKLGKLPLNSNSYR